MNNRAKYIKIPLIKSIETIKRIANEEAIVRRISKSNGYILLEPLNREYDTTVYKEDLGKTIEIIGKVITLIRNI